jgi:hypothetical protein
MAWACLPAAGLPCWPLLAMLWPAGPCLPPEMCWPQGCCWRLAGGEEAGGGGCLNPSPAGPLATGGLIGAMPPGLGAAGLWDWPLCTALAGGGLIGGLGPGTVGLPAGAGLMGGLGPGLLPCGLLPGGPMAGGSLPGLGPAGEVLGGGLGAAG